MEMNNLRVESHVAQKNRRHKLRFQQNSGDQNHHQPPQDHHHFETHRPISYDPNIFPSEILNSIARNPHLLLPHAHGFVQDQDSDPENPVVGSTFPNSESYKTPQNSNIWKAVVPSQHQEHINSDWNVVNYSNSFDQDLQNVHQKHYGEVPAFGSSPFYQNTLQEVVTSATIGVNNTSMITQGLSLSLSSVPHKDVYPIPQSGSKPLKSDLLPDSEHKPLMGSLMGISSFAHRNTGPLGPFTGYATILKNSKYLKPAQELLNDNSNVGDQELVQASQDVYSQKILEEEMSRVSGDSGASGSSSSTLYGSNEHVAGRSSSGGESYRPEFHQKKAKLMYMQDEVCRRYKQYLQQMQMVISSFEMVAGLSAATPYVCLALKTVSRHFHFVKKSISEQLTPMKKTLGEGAGLCSPTSDGKGFDGNVISTSSSRLKSMEHNFQRLGKSGGGGSGGGGGFFGPQQPAWRPQRGLPERAISILKAWLFDHFLHPYPSDADKHMLATQTGLTRNQVSNWFINARVRIWKPMVEEIHTLETKGLAPEQNSNNPPMDGQDTSRMDPNRLQPECSRNPGTLTVRDEPNEQQWDHEKRYQIPPAMDRFTSVMPPYPRTAFDIGGMGPVSLTLGLRQNAEHVQQLQQQEHQLRQHFGSQLIHDYVG